jgi:hypothetical protein
MQAAAQTQARPLNAVPVLAALVAVFLHVVVRGIAPAAAHNASSSTKRKQGR